MEDPLPPVAPAPAPPEHDHGLFARVITAIGRPFSLVYVFIMAILIYEVVLRYVFRLPTLWVHETSTFLSAVAFLVGGVYCVATNRHIRIVLLYDAVGPRIRRWLDVFIYAICAASTLFFSYGAWLSAKRAIFAPSGQFRLETSGTAWNPPYPSLLKLLMVAALLAMSVQFLIFMLRALRRKETH
ncbi:TRAP transporter small permease subunit [Paracoccus sp. S1E-3]|uniref:TRAP transporter small permease subunit n=1 Tax=Paracoccus sp. S1E-3 TaxID=2756130 RepID=UPI0015EEB084|nr:TRAP transporter small permease [Paracoccus sp. S1E-3]MBA4491695.1 TRAP transporter small permease [Paracoccus sp. S1E-3]